MDRAATFLKRFDKIFGKPARPISGYLTLSRPISPVLSRFKAPPRHRHPTKRSGHAQANQPRGEYPDKGRQMAKSVTSRALRALFLACGLAWVGPAAAGTLLSPGVAVLIKKSVEPFGLPTAI